MRPIILPSRDAVYSKHTTTTETQQIRRRTNGTIDIDYYRNHSLMLRRETMANVARGVNFSVLRRVAAAALIVAFDRDELARPGAEGHRGQRRAGRDHGCARNPLTFEPAGAAQAKCRTTNHRR